MLARIEKTTLYQENCPLHEEAQISTSPSVNTPRRQLRQKRLERAADLISARKRNIVIGRQSWPTDDASSRFNDAVDDMEGTGTSSIQHSNDGGGFIS